MVRWMRLALLLLALGAAQHTSAEVPPQLWNIDSPKSSMVIHSLEDEGLIDIWGSNDTATHAIVHNEVQHALKKALEEKEISHNVIFDDLYQVAAEERAHMEAKRRRRRKRATGGQMSWDSYHRLSDIEGLITYLVNNYGNYVSSRVIGYSHEGRPLYLVRIADDSVTSTNKMKIWIEGGIHAREWISPAVSTYIMLLAATKDDWLQLLNEVEWYIVPVANPDGYEYTFKNKETRLWRKNRSPSPTWSKRQCMGVDLNRNWDEHWGVGASEDPCRETYRGAYPNSEPETNHLKDAMIETAPIGLFITFHSFGETVLYPYGWQHGAPPNVKNLRRVAKRFTTTVNNFSRAQTDYSMGGSGPLYGLASGATDDWAYGKLGTPYSYTIELRDQGTYGFELPESLVQATVTETAAGVYCMVGYMTDMGHCKKRRTNSPTRGHSVRTRARPSWQHLFRFG